MIKQLHLIILHWICKHDKKVCDKYNKKFNQHSKRFLEVYNKGFKGRTGDNDT